MASHTAQVERFFREADADHSGYLTLDELTGILKRNGYKVTDEQVRGMFNAIDADGEGKVTFEEYMVAMGERPPQEHKAARMRQVFRSFDKNGDGQIDVAELRTAFEQMKGHLSEAEIKRMMSLIDKNKSGSISYEEFIESAFGKQS